MSEHENPRHDLERENLMLNEFQALLSEKRTALSTMRTGLAVFAFPLSVLSVLIATSRMYETKEVLQWMVPLLSMNLGLTVLAIYLIAHSLQRLHHYNRLIEEFKRQHSRIGQLLR